MRMPQKNTRGSLISGTMSDETQVCDGGADIDTVEIYCN